MGSIMGPRPPRRRDARTRPVALAVAAAFLIAASPPAETADAGGRAALDDAVSESVTGNATAAEAQGRIDEISDDIDALATTYRTTLQQTRALRVYTEQMEVLISEQEAEMESLRGQIEQVTSVGREVLPLMQRMIDTLDAFVALDVPFLKEERVARVHGLRDMMKRADVTLSEKYRRLLEAYQIESEYGRTIEAYRGELTQGETSRSVDFLRFGRIALLFQTLDGGESGMWDQEAKVWQPLGGSYRIAIRDGLRMARKQSAPDLVRVPVRLAEVTP
jgi:hypothetical protein